MKKLNLGCGQNKIDGYINVDKYDSFAPDIVWDLEKFPWPFETNSVDEIALTHVLEHLGKETEIFLSIMKELYRVARDGAKINIAVPHPRSDGFTGDPTHVRLINEAVMSLFSKKNNAKWRELGWPNTPLATYIDVDFDIENITYRPTADWLQKFNAGKITQEDLTFAASSYFNVIDEIKMVLVAHK